ncbi:hypothetical protein HYC85_001045 [Camellia sinensis]|uniref:CCR4-Not complex component Not1 C-terminal domain-containing protein n=1 Tax=Camellia sinensis TaxID=4442 RepID=A0A7J7I5P7_CAMSI|nr:hypothetical protein HYC85_001045 [Camellia sinensis]
MQLKPDLLAAIFRYLLQWPNFSTVFCEAVRTMVISEQLLTDFCDALHLSVSEKIGIGLALANSENVDIRTSGQNFCMAQTEELRRNSAVIDSSEQIQNIIMFLIRSEGLSKYVDSFMQLLSLMEPKERTPLILAPLLSDDFYEASSPPNCLCAICGCCRNMELFYGCRENEFDAILAEMVSETSMADIMSELGYGCTVDVSHCNEVLSLFLPLTEATVSRILGTITRTHTGLEDNQNCCLTFYSAIGSCATCEASCLSSWNVHVLVDSIKQLAPDINWINVVENLDHEGFYIPSEQAFFLFMSIYLRACQDPFPLHAICRSVWKNVDGQLSFLRYAVSASPEIFTFSCSARKLACANGWKVNEVPHGLANHAWLSLDLLEVLCQLAEGGRAKYVQQILEFPLKQCPELLLLGIAQINTPYNLLQWEVFSTVFPIIVGDAAGSGIVLQLWQSNTKLVLRGFIDSMKTDQGNIVTVLEICQELKILLSLLEQIPFYFSIRLAALATQKEYIDLEKWLNDNIRTHKDIFFEACLNFVKEILFPPEDISANSFQHSGALANLNVRISPRFLKALEDNNVQITSEKLSEELKWLCKASKYVGLRLQNVENSETLTPNGYSNDTEADANTYLDQVFDGRLSIDDMVQILARFKESSERREQLIFECMVKNLLEEYQFFPQYPEMQLKIAAILVGSLIKHQLLSNLTLSIAVHTVLEALRKPPDTKHTLARISSSHLISNGGSSSFTDTHSGSIPTTVEMVEIVGPRSSQHGKQLSSFLPVQQIHQGLLGDGHKAHSTSGIFSKPILPPGNSSNVSLSDIPNPQKVPASDIQDKILFLINNISSSNMEAKAKEFTEILSEQYYPWFAQYMVMKRASIEPNFHDLYMKFLDNVNSRALNKEIVKAAYENCKVLLRSKLIKSSSEERSLLKNLGSWLGKFTIGRNQVLRAREIDPKSLIIEAFEKGLMIAVIPFTSKILEPCQSSLAYQPPNPWTMAILGLLVEIYALPNLKMNLKFDIEVLFKNLGVDMKEVKPTSLLKIEFEKWKATLIFLIKILGHPSHNWLLKSTLELCVELQPEISNSSQSGGQLNLLSQYTGNLHFVSGPLMEDEKMATLSLSDRLPSGQRLSLVPPSQSPYSVGQLSSPICDIGSHIIFNQKLSAMGLQYFQRIVPLAMERAIKEVMAPVVQRSVTIAIQTTKELVLKDYAMESDETCIYNAAHLMVASLAGSLAHVTCKEPLRVSISSQLRNLLQGFNITNEAQEEAVAIVLNDNLDLGCAVIEHAATDNALKTVDNEITIQLSLRRKHREGVGPSYYNASMYTQGPMGVIPEALRPRPGHLSHSQQRDFIRFPWQNQSSQSSNEVPTDVMVSSSDYVGTGVSCACVSPTRQLNPALYSSGLRSMGLSSVAQPVYLISEELDPGSTQLIGGSSTRMGATDGVVSHGAKSNNVASLSSAATAPEQHFLETSNAVKELEGAVPPLTETSTTEHMASGISEHLFTTGDALEKYQIVAQKLEMLITEDTEETAIQVLIAQIPEIMLKCISRDEAALAVGQKVFKSLYEKASSSSHVSAHIAILASIRDVCKLVVKELTSWVIYSNEERKFNRDIIVGLIRKDLLNLTEYNMHMAKLIDAGRNKSATEFAISLLQTLLIQESRVSVSELPNLVDVLAKVATRPGASDSLQQLVKTARNPAANAAVLSGFSLGKDDKAKPSIEKKGSDNATILTREEYINADSGAADDPASFHDQVSTLFAEWYKIYELHGTNEATCTRFLLQLQQSGYFNGDDMSDRFFRHLMELSVACCLSTEGISSRSLSFQSSHTSQNLSFLAIDVYAKLVVLVLKILSVTVRVIQKDAEEKRASFNPRPYFRLFINWFFNLLAPDSIIEGCNFQVLTAFGNAFHLLQPLKVPAFSDDLVMIHFLYKGTLRVLLVLLHDFPEFLCDYHFSFCDVIPSSCIQMRNVILSAFPHNMRLPDPSTPNLKIDLLAEINQSPRIFSEVDAALKAKQMKSDVDEYLKTRYQGTFLSELVQRLLLMQNEATQAGTWYNIPLINSLVLYVGMQTIQQLEAKNPHPLAQMTNNDSVELLIAMDVFWILIADFDSEGRYLFLNAIVNQLRYPNNHTHFFSYVLLYLFVNANQEIIQEQITRVLLERLIVNKPHPWGLLITFIELIKNPKYNFWSRSFTRCAPEIEKLFESVSRSCGGPKPVDESIVYGGIPDSMH